MSIFRPAISAVVLVATIFGGSYLVMPELTVNAATLAKTRIEVLLAPDCETQPVVCLKERGRRLEQEIGELEDKRASVDAALSDIDRIVAEHRMLVSMNSAFLAQGRNALKNHLGGAVFFANVEYPTSNSFERQLELYFMEGERLNAILVDAEKQLRELETARQTLISRRTEIKAALAMVPSKIALAEAKQTFQTIDDELTAIDDVLRKSAATKGVVDPLLRTTKETAMASQLPASPRASFQAWLASDQ